MLEEKIEDEKRVRRAFTVPASCAKAELPLTFKIANPLVRPGNDRRARGLGLINMRVEQEPAQPSPTPSK